MALLLGMGPLHLPTVSLCLPHCLLHQLAPATSHMRSSHPVQNIASSSTSCSSDRIKHMHHTETSQTKNVTQLHDTKTLFPAVVKYCALLSVPLVSAFLLTSAARAFSTDSFSSSSFHPLQILTLADLDPSLARLLISILGPVFTSLNLLFIIRIVMSWYPQLPVDKLPYIIAFAPTEPVLEPTRKLIPPVGGVDVSPVIWVALMSFLNEVLLGQQGLLVLLSQQQI